MKNIFFSSLIGVIGLFLIQSNISHAVITEFDDIALDGAGTEPFIRFDGPLDRFIVAFNSDFAFYDGNTYAFRIYPTADQNQLVLRNSNVGIGTIGPTERLHVEGNVFVSGNLELGSSRTIKSGIQALTAVEALKTFKGLVPVKFNYNHSPDEQSVGFIAEDVPDLVASKNRKSLSSMDMVAVLTKVVQEQQKAIELLQQEVAKLSQKSKGQ